MVNEYITAPVFPGTNDTINKYWYLVATPPHKNGVNIYHIYRKIPGLD